jgi:hypothetical protein
VLFLRENSGFFLNGTVALQHRAREQRPTTMRSSVIET